MLLTGFLAKSIIPEEKQMELLSILNSDIVFPLVAFMVVIIYLVTRFRNRRKFKR